MSRKVAGDRNGDLPRLRLDEIGQRDHGAEAQAGENRDDEEEPE
jgi:hypothetical protein